MSSGGGILLLVLSHKPLNLIDLPNRSPASLSPTLYPLETMVMSPGPNPVTLEYERTVNSVLVHPTTRGHDHSRASHT
jgi:hypothetical protein